MIIRSHRVPPAFNVIAAITLVGVFASNSALMAQTESPTAAAADYSQLAKAEVSAAVKLTTEQQATVQQIIAERDAAMAAAEEPARPGIQDASNEKLKAVLTADQQRLFTSLFAGKTLRFNFRSQKWAEVLDWIAREADLSLVMETPPPGVFNYSDSKDYTTTESIDLLNGWLLTKGFTLVRRERMLMCLDLKGGLPEGAVPRISPEELASRGRYEFVSILFPLDGRPAEPVLMEVKPLLGSYGKAEALAQTQQLLVYDTAANLRVIEQIVKKVPIPEKPVGPAPEPPKPVLVVYPIEHANPTQAGEVLKQIVIGTLVIDEKARQISVNAVPSEQDKAKIIIGQLESNQGPDRQPTLQLYSVQVSDADQMLATLKLIAPDGQYRIDPISGKLISWATTQDQARIAESLEKIQAEQPQGAGRQLQVYTLRRTDPAALSTILATVVPGARITVNPVTRSLIAFGSLTDHEAIRALIEQTESQTETDQTARELKTYQGLTVVSSSVISLLTTSVPNSQVIADSPNQRLLVMATAAEHAQVELLLKTLSTAESGGKQLRLYDADLIDVSSVTSLLSTLVPQATVTSDLVNKRLMIVATESDHTKVTEMLEQVQLTEADSVRTLKSYPLQPKTTSATVVTLLTSLVPRALVSADETNRRLLITASEKEHALVAQVIEQVEKETIGVLPELKFYPLAQVNGSTSLAILQSITPLARITYLPDGNRFSVFATKDDHAAFAAALQELETTASDTKRALKFYDVAEIGAADARALLSTTFSDVTFIPTAEQNKLMAWVSMAQDERIQATLAQLISEKPFEATRTMQLYSIAELGPTASTVLSQAVPKAAITPGARADQLAIVATAADHEKLNAVLQQLHGSKVVAPEKVLTVHPIKGTTPSAVLQILQPLVDADVQLTVDAVGKQLFVRALPEKQERIKAVIAQVTASLADGAAKTTKTYFIGAPNADEAQEVLVALFPDAKIVIDSDRKMIVATATAEQHATIEQIATEMKSGGPDSDVPIPTVFELKNSSATETQTLLQSMYSRFDNVRISVNEKTGRLVVVARKNQLDAIRALIEQLDLPGEPAAKQELAVFALHRLDGLAVQQALRPLLPQNAEVTADRIGRQLFVSASSEDMPAIRELVQQMISSPTTAEGLETRSYRLRRFEADEAQEVLGRLFPDATMVTDVSQEMLVATATPAQHETILKVVEQMTSTERIKNGPSARVYPLKAADGDNAVQVFSSMFTRTDDVRVSFDGKSRALIAVARPEQHELIKAIVDQLEPTGTVASTQTLEVYPLSGMDGLTAVQFAEGLLKSVDPAATVSWQKTSRQLIVSTTADGHIQLNAAMSRLQENEAREMDVIQLRLLSASSAQNAIEGLYGDSFTNDDDYPVIQADEDLQQLLIRGSKKQLLDIRTLLIKMGETGLSEQAGGNGTNRNLRVIAMPGDVEPTLRKIQDLWPRVRKNPIRVIRPEGESSAQPPADAPAPGGNGQFSVPAESLPEETDEAAKQPAKPDSSNDAAAPEKPASEKPVNLQAAEASPAAPALGDVANEQSSPVIIIPGPGRLTIASDDLDALDQLESILRATTPFSPGTGVSQRNRDFSIYQLRNAGAEEVAETLESIYESRAGALAFGSVIIVPETRMNALIVYGGRTDRDRIEQLLEILDTEKLPDSGRIFRTEVIPVKHADASKIEDVLRGVYRTEMSAGGTRRAIEIPAGIDSSVASVLRQINAASSAPLLTIEVQVETNSLVVKAPQNLIDELRELITKLDDTAQTNRSRGVTLVPLKQTNTRRVMRILNDVLDD